VVELAHNLSHTIGVEQCVRDKCFRVLEVKFAVEDHLGRVGAEGGSRTRTS
jgi:hypothetical protein